MIVIGTGLVESYLANHAGHGGIRAARPQYQAWLDIVGHARWSNPRTSRRCIQRRAFSRPAGSSLTSRATTIDGWLRSNIGQEPWRSGFSEPTTNTIE